MKVTIVDYEMGNVASVKKALDFLKINSIITNCISEIKSSDYILLPGVGSFQKGMENLHKLRLVEILNEEVIVKKKPFLGICLGMQLIAETGNEPTLTDGLGWIPGDIVKIEAKNKRIPHTGWNNITITQGEFFKGISSNDFYFIHSYHFKTSDTKTIAATVNYGEDLVASVQKENIFAVQFHPEKSQQAGLTLLKNFFNA